MEAPTSRKAVTCSQSGSQDCALTRILLTIETKAGGCILPGVDGRRSLGNSVHRNGANNQRDLGFCGTRHLSTFRILLEPNGAAYRAYAQRPI